MSYIVEEFFNKKGDVPDYADIMVTFRHKDDNTESLKKGDLIAYDLTGPVLIVQVVSDERFVILRTYKREAEQRLTDKAFEVGTIWFKI